MPSHASASAARWSFRFRWPEWAGYAAAGWSLIYGLLGLWWALDGAGFPFGPGDPRADEVGSLFGAAEPGPMGAIMAATGLLGGGVALAMARSSRGPRTRLPLIFAGALSAFLVVVVPDIRVAQNFAYLFFAYTGLWDWPLVFMLFCMAGGALWAATAVAYHRRIRRACEQCGRSGSRGSSASAARWGRWATYAAAMLALPYPIVRIAWGLGIPLGVPAGSLDDSGLGLRIGESVLGGLAVGGAVLTLGLTQRWGEVFPRWIPRLRGRRVPIWLAVVPATWAAVVMSQAGLRIVTWTLTGEASITADDWGSGAPGLFWLPWGVALGAATYAYYLRRRGTCAVCGRGADGSTYHDIRTPEREPAARRAPDGAGSSPQRPRGGHTRMTEEIIPSLHTPGTSRTEPTSGGDIGRLWLAIRLLLVALVAAVLGLAALIGVAAWSAQPLVFLLAGFLVFLGATTMGIIVVTRSLPVSQRRRTRRVAAGLTIGAGALVLGAGVLAPLPDPRLPPAPVPGQEMWDLDTGSRIAIVRLPAAGARRPTPVIFLHGGPGVPDMRGDAAYFGRLTRDGFDVYVYDQVGSGRSARLADPTQYTVARHVADLEAIRRRIGAERVVLIGHSWGAVIGAGYLSEHGAHVAKAVFASPGPLPGTGDTSDRGALGRLGLGVRLGVYGLLVRPRALLGYALLQVNPRAAHALVGDGEMDARFDRIYNRGRTSFHCDGAAPGPELHGLGFYAWAFPQSAASEPAADPRPALRGMSTPALIIKGSCDYLSWSSAVAYRDALPDARLIYLPGAGHNVYQDRPDAFLAAVRAFLTGQPLPVAPWDGSAAPADFEGPA
jgi:proline iminopeptidase